MFDVLGDVQHKAGASRLPNPGRAENSHLTTPIGEFTVYHNLQLGSVDLVERINSLDCAFESQRPTMACKLNVHEENKELQRMGNQGRWYSNSKRNDSSSIALTVRRSTCNQGANIMVKARNMRAYDDLVFGL
jgi:hypothetical protein